VFANPLWCAVYANHAAEALTGFIAATFDLLTEQILVDRYRFKDRNKIQKAAEKSVAFLFFHRLHLAESAASCIL
jgi:hypothetical protein